MNATTYFRWTLTLLLIYAVFLETGGWTALAILLITAEIETRNFIDLKKRDYLEEALESEMGYNKGED